jgi:virginiamycin B lyase
MIFKWIALAAPLALFIAVPTANAESTKTATGILTEWQVPWSNTRPRDPWVGPDGTVWFVGQLGHYVATLDPESGQFRRYDLEEGTGPHTVITNEAGAWYAGNRADHVGLIDPDSGHIEKIMLPGDGRRDPHTMDFTRDGNIWFTAQHGNQVGYLDTRTREITLHDTHSQASRPYGLMNDAEDRPWITLFGTNRLATVSGPGGEVREIELPRAEARPRRPAITPDGRVWYVDFAHGHLGYYRPEDGSIREWPTPGGATSGPYAIAVDSQGRVWFSETGRTPNRLIPFDPQTETFLEPVELSGGGGIVRHMVYHAPSNTLWFGADTGTIGRVEVH